MLLDRLAHVAPGLLCAGIPRLLICAEPDFAFGHRITQTIDAVLKSIAERRWVRVDEV